MQLCPRVEGPDDTFAWDSRLRKLAACCRHADCAPVSFYGLRKACDVDPLSWEDRDIIRLEIKQLVDSFESVCGSLRGTDELLLMGKKLEQEQIRTLASSFSQVRDELDLKDAALVAAARKEKQIETQMLREKVGRLSAEEEMTEAQGSYMSNHRIFSAMESVVLHTKMDTDAMHGKTITNLKEELVGAMKYIVELRSDKTKMQAQLELSINEMEEKISNIQRELAEVTESLEQEQQAHMQLKSDFDESTKQHQEDMAREHTKLEACGQALESTKLQLQACETRLAKAEADWATEIQEANEQQEQLQQQSARTAAEYKLQVAGLEEDLRQLKLALAESEATSEALKEALDLEKSNHAETDQKFKQEVRRLNGNFLSARSEKRQAEETLEQAKADAATAAEAAAARETELLGTIEVLKCEVAKASEVKQEAETRLEKVLLMRATAIVESQAERSLREAAETSKVFDNVRVDFAFDKQERTDLDRVLDAATYRLMEVSDTNQAILGSTNRLSSSMASPGR